MAFAGLSVKNSEIDLKIPLVGFPAAALFASAFLTSALNLNQDIEDILITLSNQIHIIDISPNKKFMIYLAADATKANLGMTRAVLRKHKADLEKNLA